MSCFMILTKRNFCENLALMTQNTVNQIAGFVI